MDDKNNIPTWRPKRTWKSVINDYGNEITEVQCENDFVLITVKINYDDIPEEVSDIDLKVLIDELNRSGGEFDIAPRAKYNTDGNRG